ncbi:hypothetical protein M9458_001564, partial [Cirrhinus mrigala]
VRRGRPDWAPPGERGRGGVERSLEGTPRPARGDGGICDEWGGAERRGNGTRPVEYNDNERHLRHSPVSSPTEELRKDKRRSDHSVRRERTRPGLYFAFSVRQSSVRGCRSTFVFVYLIIKCLNVCRFPPPSSRSTNCVTLVPKPGRKEGHAVRRALAAERDRGAEEVGQHEGVDECGCPKRWCWNSGIIGGTEGSLPCSEVTEGWLPSERERRSRRRSPGGRSLLPSAMLGRSRERGTRCRLPSIRRSHHRPPGGGGALSRPPKELQYHRMAPRVKDAQLVEDRAQSRGYPPACEGRWG